MIGVLGVLGVLLLVWWQLFVHCAGTEGGPSPLWWDRSWGRSAGVHWGRDSGDAGWHVIPGSGSAVQELSEGDQDEWVRLDGDPGIPWRGHRGWDLRGVWQGGYGTSLRRCRTSPRSSSSWGWSWHQRSAWILSRWWSPSPGGGLRGVRHGAVQGAENCKERR